VPFRACFFLSCVFQVKFNSLLKENHGGDHDIENKKYGLSFQQMAPVMMQLAEGNPTVRTGGYIHIHSFIVNTFNYQNNIQRVALQTRVIFLSSDFPFLFFLLSSNICILLIVSHIV
jgi:hypothetical protein